MESNKRIGLEKRAMTRVTEDERQSWVSLAFIWIGTMICIPMLLMGGILSTQMTLNNIIIASALGFGITSLIMILTGIQSADLGLPSSMCTTKAFGDRGSSLLTSLAVFVSQMGWFGIQTAVAAEAFSKLMGIWNINFPFWLSSIIWGSVMLVTAVYGYELIKLLNYIAVPALILLSVYGAVYTANIAGWESLMGFTPKTSLAMTDAISLMIGLFALGVIISGDYARYAKKRTDVVKATLIGVVPAAVLMIAIGAVTALATGYSDITDVFADMGLPVISMLILILATWTTNTGNAYTSGLAAMKVFNLEDEKRPTMTLISGAIGTLIAIAGLASALEAYIAILSGIIPPIAGVMASDYWIVGKGRAENWHPVEGFNWNGIIAWALGSTIALFFSFFSPALDGIIVSGMAYIALNSIFGQSLIFEQDGPADDLIEGKEGTEERSN